MKGLTPIILIVCAVAGFIFYINPQFSKLKEIQSEKNDYQNAVQSAESLRDVRRELEIKYNDISSADLLRLEKILPAHVDNVRLVMEIDAVASKYGITIKDVDLQKDTPATGRGLLPASASKAYNTVTLGIEFDATYGSAMLLLADLEKSLRVIDITGIDVNLSNTGVTNFKITMDTYWVKQ